MHDTRHLSNPWTLFKIELAKFKSYAVIQFMLGLGVILFPLALISCKELVNDLPPPLPGTSIIYEFPTIWDYQGYLGNWIVFFFFGCTLIFTITSEVNFRTQRQNIISGYTRRNYFVAKLMNLLALAVLATIIYTLSCVIIGCIFTEDWYMGLIFDNNWAIPRFFVMSVGYLSFAMLVAMIFRKNGLAIFFYVAYVLIFEYILRGIQMWFLFKMNPKDTSFDSAFYWPLNVFEDNMPFPLMKLESFLDADMPFNLLLDPKIAFGLSIVYLAGFVALSYRVFLRNDI